MTAIGEAHAFFRYIGKAENIPEELPRARRVYNVPDAMALDLQEIKNFEADNDILLEDLVREAHLDGITHILTARLPDVLNKRVAEDLSCVMTGLYLSPDLHDFLYEHNDTFRCSVVYKEGNDYLFLDN